MSAIGTGYDLSAAQFSPDGRVFQVEYALKAVENSGTAIGIRGKDGVVLAVERLIISKLYNEGSNKRIFNIDSHIGMAISGLYTDGIHLVEYARGEARDYRHSYGTAIPAKNLSTRLAGYMHAHTLYGFARPFGCSVLIAGYDEHNGAELFSVDPAGVAYGYRGCAVGKAKQSAKTEIEKLKMENMTARDLVTDAAKIVYTVHDEVKDKGFELELSWVGKVSNGKHENVPKAVLDEAESAAKAAIAESDEEEDDAM